MILWNTETDTLSTPDLTRPTVSSTITSRMDFLKPSVQRQRPPKIPTAHEPARPTLATVLACVADSDALTERQRQDLASALRTVGRALCRPLEDVSACPRTLRERLKSVVPAAAGISPRRWTNATSLARQAIRHAGIDVAPGRAPLRFSPGWTALFRLVEAKHACIALSRLARYCTNHDIEPEEVTDAVFQAFLDELLATDMRQLPHKVHRQAAVIWVRLASTTSAWPQHPITVPSYSRVYALPWSRFPESLKAELDAYLDHLAAGSDLLDAAAFKPLRPASITSVRQQLTAYISALVHRGHDPQTLCTLTAIVELPLVKDGLRFFLDRAPANSTKQAHGIASCLRSLARHWVGVDDSHLVTLRTLCKRLDTASQGLAAKNRERLRQFDDPVSRGKLLALPETLARKAARCKVPSATEALWIQTALAVELLLMLPLRRRNLVRLNLEQHLRRTRGGVVHLVIPGEEVKNGTEIASVLPVSVVKLLDLYLERYRTVLLSQPSAWLFPGVGDRPKSLERMALQISDTVKRETGLLVNVHLFRHIAAKLYLDANPGAYGVVRLLHGHKSVDTTTKYYCGAETGAAFGIYEQQVVGLRQSVLQAQPAKSNAKASAPKKKKG